MFVDCTYIECSEMIERVRKTHDLPLDELAKLANQCKACAQRSQHPMAIKVSQEVCDLFDMEFISESIANLINKK